MQKMNDDKSIIIYTFRTFKGVYELNKIYKNIYIFGKLKNDLNDFLQIIKFNKPKYILGIAKNRNKISEFESITINNFNNKKIMKSDIYRHKLYIPEFTNTRFMIANDYTTSFCNYSMFKIMEYIKENRINTYLSFVHVRMEDISELAKIY